MKLPKYNKEDYQKMRCTKPTQKKRGRPKGSIKQNNKKKFTIRYSEEEHKVVMKALDSLGESNFSSFSREATLEKAQKILEGKRLKMEVYTSNDTVYVIENDSDNLMTELDAVEYAQLSTDIDMEYLRYVEREYINTPSFAYRHIIRIEAKFEIEIYPGHWGRVHLDELTDDHEQHPTLDQLPLLENSKWFYQGDYTTPPRRIRIEEDPDSWE